jgi:hypothetical protein
MINQTFFTINTIMASWNIEEQVDGLLSRVEEL